MSKHTESLESIYVESLNQSIELADLPTDNYVNLDPIQPNYYQLESSGNFTFEQATFECTEAMNNEKLTLSSIDYLLSMEDSNDFFEFIKSDESVSLCKSQNDRPAVKSDPEEQSVSLATEHVERKSNKVSKTRCKYQYGIGNASNGGFVWNSLQHKALKKCKQCLEEEPTERISNLVQVRLGRL